MNNTFVSKNLTEELIELYIGDCMKQLEVCKCSRCQADIRAAALNRLGSRYVVSDEGDIFTRVNAMSLQSKADIITAIMQAIEIVQKSPRH